MKQCSKCKEVKPLEEFHRNSSKPDGRGHACKPCQRVYNQKHYRKNKQYYVAKARQWDEIRKDEVREFLVEYFSNHHCVDCGEDNLVVLEFDHKDRDSKTKSIAKMLQRGTSLTTIKDEISKCEVRCANCHKIRTAKQFGWWRIFIDD